MEKNIKIALLVVIIVIAVIGFLIVTRWVALEVYDDVADMVGTPPESPVVTYDVDKTAGTITITSIEGNTEELLWSNVYLYGSYLDVKATLPSGTIDEGDVITECVGPVLLIWNPTGAYFIEETFN